MLCKLFCLKVKMILCISPLADLHKSKLLLMKAKTDNY